MALKRRSGEMKMSEDSEQIDELSKKTLGSYVVKSLAPSSEKSVSNLASKGGYKLGQARDDDYTAGEKEDAKSVKRSLGVLTAVRKMTKEEAEQIDELSKKTLGSYVKKAGVNRTHIAGKQKSVDDAMTGVSAAMRYVSDTDNLDKSRSQLKKVSNRLDNKDFNRQQGISKAIDRLTKEEAEQVVEGQKPYVSSESGGIGRSAVAHVLDSKGKIVQSFHKKEHGAGYMKKASDYLDKNYNKMKNEEAELEEKLDMKKASMGTVVKDFQKSDAPQFMGKSQKKRQVMAIAAKLSADRGGKPLNKEERLLIKLADISETHKRTMVSVFEKLNEDNQYAFMQACDTADGIEQMLDFSISYRGE
jgi:hypothetical protein